MSTCLVVYGTTDGHTARIADAVARTLRGLTLHADVIDARDAGHTSPGRYDLVVVMGSLHAQGYQRALRAWVRRHAIALSSRPTAFLSVCLGVLEQKPATDQALESIIRKFFRETGWTPNRYAIVAGALPYTRYGWLKKRVMRRIAARAGGGTDITRDYEYTDWHEVTRFAASCAVLLAPEPAPGVPACCLPAAQAAELATR